MGVCVTYKNRQNLKSVRRKAQREARHKNGSVSRMCAEYRSCITLLRSLQSKEWVPCTKDTRIHVCREEDVG